MRHHEALVFQREGQVLLGRVAGIVTLERLLMIRAAQCAQWEIKLPLGTVMDFREATFTLSLTEWEQAFETGRRWTYNVHRPTAMVVRDDQLEFFRRGAVEFAQHGIIQAAFTALPTAMAWAASRRESLRQAPRKPGRRKSETSASRSEISVPGL